MENGQPSTREEVYAVSIVGIRVAGRVSVVEGNRHVSINAKANEREG